MSTTSEQKVDEIVLDYCKLNRLPKSAVDALIRQCERTKKMKMEKGWTVVEFVPPEHDKTVIRFYPPNVEVEHE